jgi:hypothetical protein
MYKKKRSFTVYLHCSIAEEKGGGGAYSDGQKTCYEIFF